MTPYRRSPLYASTDISTLPENSSPDRTWVLFWIKAHRDIVRDDTLVVTQNADKIPSWMVYYLMQMALLLLRPLAGVDTILQQQGQILVSTLFVLGVGLFPQWIINTMAPATEAWLAGLPT